MVGLAVHHIVALIVAAGNDGKIRNIQSVQVIPAVRVGDPHHPGFAGIVLRPGGADIAAHTDEKSRGGRAGHLLHGPALGHRAHIQPQQGVGKIDGGFFGIDDHIVPAGVPACFLQRLPVRQGGVCRIVDSLGPCLVP